MSKTYLILLFFLNLKYSAASDYNHFKRDVVNQSSIFNKNAKNAAAELQKWFIANCTQREVKCLVANYCERYLTKAHFFRHLAIQRRRYEATPENWNASGYFEKFPAEDTPPIKYTVVHTLQSRMHFETRQKFSIETLRDVADDYAKISGGCVDFVATSDRSLISDVWISKYGDGNWTDAILDEFVAIFTRDLGKIGDKTAMFSNNFMGLIDTNEKEIYDSTNFLRYMKRFGKRYTWAANVTNVTDYFNLEIEPEIKILTKSADHVVFQKSVIYDYNLDKTLEVWEYQVELIYNLDGNATWQINQIYMTPPHQFIHFDNFSINRTHVEFQNVWKNRFLKIGTFEKSMNQKKTVNFTRCSDRNFKYPERIENATIYETVIENSKNRLEFDLRLVYVRRERLFEIWTKFEAIYSAKYDENYVKNVTLTCPVIIADKSKLEKASFTTEVLKNADVISGTNTGVTKGLANLFGQNFGNIFQKQSSIYNADVDVQNAVQQLKSHFEEKCGTSECLVATLCNGEHLKFSTFFKWLAIQRKRFDVSVGSVVSEITQNPGKTTSPKYRITIPLKSLMHFQDNMILEIETIKGESGQSWNVRSVKLGGGCSSSRTHRSKSNLIPMLENPGINGDGKMDDRIYDELLDSTIFRGDFSNSSEENLKFFEKDLRVIIDTNIFENYTYSLDEYAKYMTRFSKRYKLRRDIMKSQLLFDQSKNPSTSVLIHNPDHLVFRTSAVYQYLPDLELGQVTTEIWEYQVEAVFNVSSWKIRQIFMEPPQFFTASSNFAELRARNEFLAEWEKKDIDKLEKICDKNEKFNGKNYVELSRSWNENVMRVVGKYDSKFDEYQLEGIFKKC